jgi:hypothetical protein
VGAHPFRQLVEGAKASSLRRRYSGVECVLYRQWRPFPEETRRGQKYERGPFSDRRLVSEGRRVGLR